MSEEKKVFTYEEIARKYDITTTKVQTIVKSTYNKIVKNLVEMEGINIFDAVLAMREYFNMSESDAFDKLNDEHKEMLRKYASEHYNIDKDDEDTDFTSLFE